MGESLRYILDAELIDFFGDDLGAFVFTSAEFWGQLNDILERSPEMLMWRSQKGGLNDVRRG